MVSRVFFLITIFFTITLSSSNFLKKVEIKNNILYLYFNTPLTKKELKSFIISQKDITKYIFDFYNTKKSKNIKYKYRLIGGAKAVRISQYKPNVIRVVVDSKKRYLLKYSQKNDAIFKISLPNVKEIKKSNLKKRVSISYPKSNLTQKEVIKKPLTPTLKQLGLKKNYTIVIDPGHGGKFSGAIRRGVREKNIVLNIAKRVYRRLKNMGFNVKMTRYSDRHLNKNRGKDLIKRARIANRLNADLFVSIHANATEKRTNYKAYGVETYFLSRSKNKRAKSVAARENKDILKSLDPATKKVLLNAVFTGPKIVLSNKLAIDVQKRILSNTRALYKNVKDGGVKGENLFVLVGAQMPAILVEIGYLSNPIERRRLLNPVYQNLIAKGISEGIINYLKNREKELE